MSFDTPSRNSSFAFLSRCLERADSALAPDNRLHARRQSQLTSAIALISLVFNGLAAVFTPAQTLREALACSVPLMVLSVVAYLLARTRFYPLAAFLIVLGLFASAYGAIIVIGRDITYTLLVYISLGLAGQRPALRLGGLSADGHQRRLCPVWAACVRGDAAGQSGRRVSR